MPETSRRKHRRKSSWSKARQSVLRLDTKSKIYGGNDEFDPIGIETLLLRKPMWGFSDDVKMALVLRKQTQEGDTRV